MECRARIFNNLTLITTSVVVYSGNIPVKGR